MAGRRRHPPTQGVKLRNLVYLAVAIPIISGGIAKVVTDIRKILGTDKPDDD